MLKHLWNDVSKWLLKQLKWWDLLDHLNVVEVFEVVEVIPHDDHNDLKLKCDDCEIIVHGGHMKLEVGEHVLVYIAKD